MVHPGEPLPSQPRGPQGLVVLAFGAMVVIWGTSFLAIRVANTEGYPPFGAAALRLLLAAAVLLAATRIARVPLPRGPALGAAVVAGVCYFGLNLPLLYWGELTVNSSTTAVLWAIYPLLIALLAHVVLDGSEPLTPRALAGAVLALLGVGLVFQARLSLDGPLAGFAAIVAGIAVSAVGTLAQKRWGVGAHPVAFNAVGVLAGAAMVVPLALAAEGGIALPPTLAAGAALLYLLVGGSLVAFPLWSWVLQRWPATRLSYQTVLSPLVAVVAGATLLAEPAEVGFLAGAGLVLAGTWLAARPARSPATRGFGLPTMDAFRLRGPPRR